MEFFAENGNLILGIVIILGAAAMMIWKFLQLPETEQTEQVEEWLLAACMQAEQELESDAGKEKLQLVYTRFEQQFPAVAMAISFETFSKWVDVALEEMQEMLQEKTESFEESQTSVN